MSSLIAVLSGLLFGIGLLASGMTDPAKVKGFLDLFGLWDPSLALVIGGAIAVGLIGFTLASRRTKSWSGEPIDLPKSTVVDWRLVLGGILFGVGWGIAGYCPGPALTSLVGGTLPGLAFVAAMVAGMLLARHVGARGEGVASNSCS